MEQDSPGADEGFPLSFPQRATWYLDRLQPGGHRNDRIALCLTGWLDFQALQAAVNHVIRRHAALRARFVVRGDRAVQVIDPWRPVRLPLVDLTNVDAPLRLALGRRLAAESARRPFDLSQGPLLRPLALRMGKSEHLFALTVHQIVNDSRSLGIWLQELAELYDTCSAGFPPTLPSLGIQYTDFALRQQGLARQGKLWEDQLAYWKRQLMDPPDVLELPTDRPRPSAQSFRGARHSFSIPKRLIEAAGESGQAQPVTVFVTLLAVFTALLFRYSRQDDILVGAPMEIRSQPGLEGIIGDFANVLILRSDLSGNPSFQELLTRVRQVIAEAQEHPDLPLERLVRELRLVRDASRNPLFQVMIEDQTPSLPGWQFKGLKSDLVEIDPKVSRFDLTLGYWETPDAVQASFEYSTDLFDATTIVRLAGHFKACLAHAVLDPQQYLSSLAMLLESERHQMVQEWNSTAKPLPSVRLHQLFERQAHTCPDSIAAVVPSPGNDLEECHCVSYGDLDRRSNRLARYLLTAGVRQGGLVGLCVERTPLMLTGLLGILKSEGAFLPLDPSFPVERLRYMLEDSGACHWLTEQSMADRLGHTGISSACLDRDWGMIRPEKGGRSRPIGDPSQTAYVMYTSGSTGHPKGVLISHRAAVNFLDSMRVKPGFTAKDVLLSVTTLSFDIAVLEIFLPLLAGGRFVLASREDGFDGKRLAELLARFDISVMQATPSTWRVLLQAGWTGDTRLRILCGGEVLTADLAGHLLQRCDALWNLYGPTETTIWSSLGQIDSKQRIWLGRPIANTQIYILDDGVGTVPVGVPGELHIAGEGLAQGYLSRPGLTAKMFIPNPLACQPGSRLYKSGDLARLRPDGNLEFLGRLDQQVKVRGFRIEPGEIEAVLRQHSSVRDVIVTAREDIAGDMRLVAYVVPHGDPPPTLTWRDYLKKHLPDYMVPSAFVTIAEAPQTLNRKINPRTLPPPGKAHIESHRDYLAPRDIIERHLVSLWEQALGAKSVGIRDDFFDLGGHSLLAAGLFAQIENAYQKRLPLAILFKKPTIEQLAEVLRLDDWKPNWSSLIPIQPAGSRPPLFLIHGAGGNVLIYRDLARHLNPDQPVYGLQSRGLDKSQWEPVRLADMAAHYIDEIQSLQPRGPYCLGGYCLGGTLAYEMAWQLRKRGQEVALLALLETYNLQAAKLSLPLKMFHLWQNAGFHLRNFLPLNKAEKAAFLRQKMGVAKRRLRARADYLKAGLASRFNGSDGSRQPFAFIRTVNDQAQLDYVPSGYSGHVVLFRPNKPFFGLEEADFGWGELVAGGLEIHELPVQPRAMLVEPYVRHLAARLQHSIDQAAGQISRKDAKPQGSEGMRL